jgi:hypothetical protein
MSGKLTVGARVVIRAPHSPRRGQTGTIRALYHLPVATDPPTTRVAYVDLEDLPGLSGYQLYAARDVRVVG